MSNRALAVAVALQAEMPELVVLTAPYRRDAGQVGCPDCPVIVVSDGLAQGFSISVYGDDGDDISGITRDVARATRSGFALGDAEMPATLILARLKTEPLLDASDYLVGERMHFQVIVHSTYAAEPAPATEPAAVSAVAA